MKVKVINSDLSPIPCESLLSGHQYLYSPIPNEFNNFGHGTLVKRLDFEESPMNYGHHFLQSPNIPVHSTVKKNQNIPITPFRFSELFNHYNTEQRYIAQRAHDTDQEDIEERLKCDEPNFEIVEPIRISYFRNEIQRFGEPLTPFKFGQVEQKKVMNPQNDPIQELPGLRRNQTTLSLYQKMQQLKTNTQYQSQQDKQISQKKQKIREDQQTTKKQQRKLILLQEAVPNSSPITDKKVVCNCKKTKCLKLYCDCFNANQICGKDCNCEGCSNNDERNEERIVAQHQIYERNKQAFGQKVHVLIEGTLEKKQFHYKGCNCKKSGCLKKYCECYQNKVNCSELCKCTGCKNCSSPLSKKKQQRFRMPIEDSRREGKRIKIY